MGIEVVLLTGVGLLILVGLNYHLKFQGVTERIVTHLIPKDFRKYVWDKHRKSFTLMELLVVITIIVILAGMLMPALQKARGMAKHARWFGARQNIMTHPNCIAYWDFEGTGSTLKCQETLGVKKAAKLNGTIYGATRVKGGGRWPGKGALQFDGDDYVIISYDSSFNIANNITVELWAKPRSIVTGMVVAAGVYDFSHYPYMLMTTGTRFQVDCYPSDGRDGNYTRMGAVPVDEWSYLVWTFDDTGVSKLYVNAVLEDTETLPFSELDGYTDIEIGTWKKNNQWFNGSIDEIAIYNRALTPEEINQHYRGGRP